MGIYAHSITSTGTQAGIDFMENTLLSSSSFPNPFDVQTTITIDFSNQSVFNRLIWEVYDIKGQLIISKITENKNQLVLDGNNFDNGVYFYHIISDAQIAGNGRFIVQH